MRDYADTTRNAATSPFSRNAEDVTQLPPAPELSFARYLKTIPFFRGQLRKAVALFRL